MTPVRVFRSLLFVPGSRPDRFEKAAASGADAIIVDLEDAVLPTDKDSARSQTLDWFKARPATSVAGIRINSPRTGDGCRDLGALSAMDARPDFVMVPKAETGVDIEIVSEALGGAVTIIAVVESGRGLRRAFDIAKQSRGGILFGGADYSASLGADLDDLGAMTVARGTIAGACAAAGVPAYDVPFLNVKDTAALETTTGKAKAFGFAGRACIHPGQVETVNRVFTPTSDMIEDARSIIAALNASDGGAVLHKGKMVDRPVILAAQRVLAQAGEEQE